jgi:hypothetical protein
METHFYWKLTYLSFLIVFMVRVLDLGRLELIICKLINYSWFELLPSWNKKSDDETYQKWKVVSFPIKVCFRFSKKWFLLQIWMIFVMCAKRYHATLIFCAYDKKHFLGHFSVTDSLTHSRKVGVIELHIAAKKLVGHFFNFVWPTIQPTN